MKLIEKGFLKRNKKFLLIALAIFLVSALAGAIISNASVGDNYGLISEAIYNHSQTGEGSFSLPDFSSTDLFIHNFFADLIVLFGGFLFSIPSVLSVIYNGFSIGAPFGADFLFASTSIIPHSIFEYPASIFALAAAFNMTWLEIKMIKNRSIRTVIDDNRIVLQDIFTMIIIMVVLLLIAAIIEGNITVWIIYWFYGLL